jgi:putative RecB family exonuclease
MGRVESHSSLSSFESCPKKYHFRYVLKLKAETEGVEAFVGKRVHEVMERLYEFAGRGHVPSLRRVFDRFHENWRDTFEPDRIRIVRDDMTVDDYVGAGERCLENAYRRFYPFDDGETLGLERPVQTRLDGDGEYAMRGVVDRVVRASDGVLEIQDYKTGRRVPRQKEVDRDRQLALYELALRDELGEKGEVRLVWHYLLSGVTRVSQRTPEQLDELRHDTIALIDRVRAETSWEPREGPLCRWCEYRDRCPLFSDEAVHEPPPPPIDAEPPDSEFYQLSLL